MDCHEKMMAQQEAFLGCHVEAMPWCLITGPWAFMDLSWYCPGAAKCTPRRCHRAAIVFYDTALTGILRTAREQYNGYFMNRYGSVAMASLALPWTPMDLPLWQCHGAVMGPSMTLHGTAITLSWAALALPWDLHGTQWFFWTATGFHEVLWQRCDGTP